MQAIQTASTGGFTAPQLASRLASASLVVLAVFALAPLEMLALTIVLGQGHFFSAYYYQAKAGRIGWRYLAAYPVVAAALFGFFVLNPDFLLLVRVASLYFVVHFLQDEVFLLGESPSLRRGLDLLPLVLLYGGFLLDLRATVTPAYGAIPYPSVVYPGAFGGEVTRLLAAAAALALLVNAALTLSGRLAWRASSLYFHLGALALFALYLSGAAVPLEYLMGSAILYHYLNWYFHYAHKYRSDRPRLGSYLRSILVINALVLVLYFTIGRHPDVPFPVGVLFLPGFFYLWTIMHIAFTTRTTDVGFWLPRPLM